MKKKRLPVMAVILMVAGILWNPMETYASESVEVRSKGNIEIDGEGNDEPDGLFTVSDLLNLWDDLRTCQETAEATRKPMVHALALKGVTVPAEASYREIADGILRIPDEYIWGKNDPAGVVYDYHNHVDRTGGRTNDSSNNAVLLTSGGCYTVPVYHVHAGNKTVYGGCYTAPLYHAHAGNKTVYGGCYTVPLYHTHAGSAAVYGGCYTSPVYHAHAGSTAAYGGCYTSPVYHAHAGSTAAYGGCYTSPVYHVHTGSTESGGGCYTVPIYHTHTSECAQEERKCNYQRDYWYRIGTHNNICYYDGECTHFDDMVKTYGHSCGRPDGDPEQYSYCSGCGFKENTSHKYYVYTCGAEEGVTVDHWDLGCGKTTSTVESYDLGCGKTTSTVESYDLGCGKTTSTVESYDLGCGKTTATVESYDLGCGKTTTTVESYDLGCGKTTTTVESYDLGCGKTSNSIEGYTLGCNHVEDQIIAVHISFSDQ